MQFSTLNRKVHLWVAILFSLPMLVVIVSGLFLQLKKYSNWIQPTELRSSVRTVSLDFEMILATLRNEPGLGVSAWSDIERLDIRPDRGIVKVILSGNREAQIELGTGRLLQTAVRRSDIIESLHDGSWFGGNTGKMGLFLPSGLALLILWITGIWMFWSPYYRRWRRGSRRNTKNQDLPSG